MEPGDAGAYRSGVRTADEQPKALESTTAPPDEGPLCLRRQVGTATLLGRGDVISPITKLDSQFFAWLSSSHGKFLLPSEKSRLAPEKNADHMTILYDVQRS